MCSSPRLLAAYHGLLRTVAPRHPPWTLFRLTIFSLAPRMHRAFAPCFDSLRSRFSTQAWSPRSLCASSFRCQMDRLHGSFILPPQHTHGLPRAITAFSLPSSCQRTRSAFVVQLWWRYGDLNPRPMACKATALATELYPQGFAPRTSFEARSIYRKGRRV